MDGNDASAVLASLASNSNVDIGGELAIEELQYNLGWIQ